MSVVNQTVPTVYGKSGCVQCNAMKRYFDEKQVKYEYIDVTQSESAYNWVTEMGYQQVPVTVIGFDHFGGFDPDRAKAALEKVLA